MKKVLFGMYLVLLHIIIIVLVTEVGNASYSEKTAFFNTVPIQEHHLIFLGDSIIKHMDVKKITPKAVNLGISGDWTHALLQRIPIYPSLHKENTIFISIGINDISLKLQTVADTFERYQAMIRLLPQQNTLVLNSILPLGRGQPNAQHINKKIQQLNQLIQTLATSSTYYLFVDSQQTMKDRAGYLKPEYHLPDGIHLSSTGYKVYTQTIKDFLNWHKLI